MENLEKDIEIEYIKYIQSIPKKINDKCVNFINIFMNFISGIFNWKIFFFIIIILYFFNKINNKQICSLLFSQIIILFIKYLIKRKRPFKSSQNIKLIETMNFDPYSFPSGHTVNAFIFAHIIKKNTNINLDLLPYFVGLSRIYLGVHYPSDVLGGIILGKILTYFF